MQRKKQVLGVFSGVEGLTPSQQTYAQGRRARGVEPLVNGFQNPPRLTLTVEPLKLARQERLLCR